MKPYKWVGYYQVGVTVYRHRAAYERLGVPEIVGANFAEARKFGPPAYAEASMRTVEAELAAAEEAAAEGVSSVESTAGLPGVEAKAKVKQ